MIVKAYQTIEDTENPDEIEEHGPYFCSRRNAWLGEGYYFWDTNIQWAHDWGQQSYGNNYIICEAEINLNEQCFDLVGNISHQMEFIEILKTFEELRKNRATVGQIIQYMINNNIFDYCLIRANDDVRGHQIPFGGRLSETITLLKRTQICLIDKTNLISHSYKVIYPENYIE